MLDRNRNRLLLSTILAGAAGISLIATSAYAQDPPVLEEGVAVDELVITGSRIRRNEFSTPAPVEVILTEESRLAGRTGVAEILQATPLASGSVQITNQFSQYVVEGGSGVNTISLRGLGGQRTLVLLNGRRLTPAGVSGTVAAADLNVLPLSMIDRIEILKDGASSIYGSDAIGGVINLITRDNFEGIQLDAGFSIPEAGGGEVYDASASWGMVRDTWHVLAGVEYVDSKSLKLGERPWGECPSEYQAGPGVGGWGYSRSYADGSPYCAFGQTNYISDFSFGGLYVYDPSSPLANAGNRNYVPLVSSPYGAYPRITNIPTDPGEREIDMLSPVKRLSGTLIGSIDLPNQTEFYFEGLITRRESEQDAYRPALFPSDVPNIIAYSFSPFNPLPVFIQSVRRLPVANFTQDVVTSRAVLGLKGGFGQFGGDFLSDWKWDANLTYGRSDGDYETPVLLSSRVANSLDYIQVGGPDDGFSVQAQGQITDAGLIRVSPVTGGSYSCAINLVDPNERCIPLDVVSPQDELAADGVLDYLGHRDKGKTKYEQFVFSAYADGPLFDLPAGPVNAVIGVEHRQDKILDNPGPEAIAQNYYGTASAGITAGKDEVNEIYGELEIPVIKGGDIADSFTISLAARYTDIETAGDDTTYKIGANWQINPVFRVRATMGTSFRGPALYENYLASQLAFTGANDPCANYGVNNVPGDPIYDNCASEGLAPNFPGYSATPTVLTAGAIGRLSPETSDNLTAGFVWKPEFADLQVSVDYFKIEIENEISRLGSSNILNLCYNDPDFRGGSPYCTLIDPRDVNGDIPLIDDSYINISNQITRGVDLNIRYRREIRDWFTTWEFSGTWTAEDSVELFTGSGFDDYNGTFSDPDFVADASVRVEKGPWTVYWQTSFLDSVSYHNYLGEPTGGRYKLSQESVIYHTASLTYEADKWEITGGVRNLFDEDPPRVSNSPYASSFVPRFGEVQLAGPYDLRGRTFFLNLSTTLR